MESFYTFLGGPRTFFGGGRTVKNNFFFGMPQMMPPHHHCCGGGFNQLFGFMALNSFIYNIFGNNNQQSQYSQYGQYNNSYNLYNPYASSKDSNAALTAKVKSLEDELADCKKQI